MPTKTKAFQSATDPANGGAAPQFRLWDRDRDRDRPQFRLWEPAITAHHQLRLSASQPAYEGELHKIGERVVNTSGHSVGHKGKRTVRRLRSNVK